MGVEDRYKKRREEEEKKQKATTQNSSEKKETRSLYNGVENRFKAKNIKTVASEIPSRIDTWFKNNEDFVSNYNYRFKGFTGSYNDPYDSTINDWISSVIPQKANFDAEAASIKAIIEENKDYFNPDYVKSVFSALDSASKVQSDILNNATEYSKYWSQWESPDAYRRYQKIASIADMTSEQIKKYLGSDDPVAFTTDDGQEVTWDYLYKTKYYEELMSGEDFEEYSKLGASVQNPSYAAANGSDNFLGWKNPFVEGEEIGNIVTFSRNNIDAITKSLVGSEGKYEGPGDYRYQYMTDDEVAIYNYYLGKGDTEKAAEYLADLDEVLNYRYGEVIAGRADRNAVSKMVFGLGAGLDQFVSGAQNIKNFITGDGAVSTTPTQFASSIISEDLGTVGGVAYDLAQTTGNMLPSILVGGLAGSVAGTATMGVSAAGNGYNEMRKLGYDEWQARGYGLLVGASEATLQYALGGISKLGGKVTNHAISNIVSKFDNAIARVAIDLGGKMLSEGLEEAVQSVLEPAFKSLMTGEGYNVDWEEVFYSGLLGALSAGLLEGAPTIAGTASSSSAANKLYGDNVQDLVTESLEIDPENAHAQRMQAKLDSGKNVSGYQLNRLAEANETAMLNNDVATIKNATVNRLNELGESGNVDVIATALTKQVTGERLTFTEREAIKSSKYAQRVANELNTENIRGGGYSSAWAEKLGTDRINADVYGRMVAQIDAEESSGTGSKMEQVQNDVPDTNVGGKVAQEPTVASEGLTEAREEKGATYETPEVKDAQTGEIEAPGGDHIREVTKKVKEIASVSNGAITVRLDNGETVNANEIDFGNEDVALVYQAAADMSTRVGGFNTDTVRVFVNGFNPDAGLTAGEYVNGFRDAYRYGAEGAPISELAKGEYTKRMTEEQRNRAFHFGRAFGNEHVESTQAKLDAKKAEASKKRSESAKIDSKTTKEGDGAMADNENTSYYDGDRNALNERQRASIEFLEKTFGNKGVKFVFFESYTDESGNRVYKNSEGNVLPAPNGYYKASDGSIWIDINAGQDGEGTILITASHELTHFIKDWSPKKFKTFAEFLYEQYGKNDIPLEAYVRDKIRKAAKNGRTISYEVAYEEVVADSCEMMLIDILNNKNEENLGKLLTKDKSLFEKIKEFFADLFKRIKAVYEGVDPHSYEGMYVREMRDVADSLQTMWTEALLDAVDTHKAISENAAEGTGTKFSMRENVEETNELIAVHNLTEAKLMKSLNLGGLPMPSIAIIKARDGHNAFGDISLVFGKDTIDPRAYRSNKVYSGDAYTPTYPRVEYKINEKAQKKVREKINGLVSDDIQSALGRVHLDSDNLTDTINRHSGDMATAFKYDYTMKYAYLLDEGRNVELPMTEKPLSYYGSRENGAIIRVAENVSREDLLKVLNGDRADGDAVEPLIRKAVSEYMAEKYTDQPEVLEVLQPNDQLTYSDLDGYAQEALNYLSKGLQQTVDYKAAKSLIDENIDQAEYEKWVNRLFSDIVEKEGIRNNKYYFTPSGNRRSFEALHYEHNLENIIKAMKEKGTQGIGGFGGGNIFGASTTEFGSVEDIKGATDRLKMMSQEEHDEIKQGFSDRFFELASSLPKNKGSFTATDDAANMLIEAVMKFSTKSGMANYLRRESEGWANYSDYIVDDLIELVRDIRNMPTGYFEAKPQRAVGFDEVATAIIPNNASEELKTKLNDWRIDYIEYEKGNDESRLEALNSLEGVRFSDRDSDGKTLTEEQQEFFKDSKVRNEKGDLLVMYHGTPNAGFTRFKSGTYFTQHKWYADRYQSPGASSLSYKKSADSPDTYAVYLNIKKPFDTRNQAEKDIFYNEYYRQWGTGTDLMESGLPDWLDGMDLQEFIEEMGYDYDGLILDEGGTGGYGEEVVSRGLSYVIFNPAQAKNIDNETPTDDPDIRYSEREIIGVSGKNYGSGVYLDSELLSNLTDEERIEMVKEYVKELGGRAFTAYDNNNNAVEVHIAEANKKFKNKSGKRVPVNKDLSQKHIKNKVKQETITLVDELVSASTYDSKKKPLYSHGWLDNHGKNDWEYWVTYVQDKENTIWKATLNVATTANGEKILYDINPIKKVEQSVTSDTSTTLMEERSVKSDTISSNAIISHSEGNVNSKFTEKDASGNIFTGESDDIRYSDRDDFYETRRELKEKYGVDTEAVLTMADGYLRNYGGVLGKTQFRKQFLDLTLEAAKFMSDTSGESIGRVNDMVLETASEIVNNPAISGELVDELRKIKKHIKDTRIKIPSTGKSDFDIVGGFDAFRRKHIGRLTLANDGIDVDAIYPEFQELFGKSWFPDNIDNVPDQLMRIAEVADASLGDYSENYYNSEEVMIDVAGEIFDKVQNIVLKASENMARINYRRSEDNLSPRGLLANALEDVAQNDIEKNKLTNYREKIGKLNAEEQKLQNLRREIKELSFATGPRNTARIEALREEATKTANRISIYDKQLLELEASKPLLDVLARERQKAYKKAEAEGREALAKYRERAAKTQEELKRRYQESKKRGTENRRKTEIRHKIKRTVGELNDMLLHGSKNRNIKSGLQEAVAAALEAINMDTVAADERIAKYNELIAKATDPDVIESLTKTRDNIRRQGDAIGDKLEAMRKAYRDIREKDAKSEYPDYFKVEAQLIENRIESVIDKVGNTPLRNMTYAQLDAVYDMYKMVLATVRNANAVFKEGKVEDLQRAAGAVMTELSTIPKLPEERSAVGDNLRGYVWNELTPYYAFSRIGSETFESFYWEAIKGQDVYARDIDEARDFASEAREKYHYEAWDFDKIHKFKLADGREFSVSLKHMMSIYAYSKRNQAADHMRKGGFFFNDKETFRKKGGVLTMIRDSEASYKIDDGSLAAIISAMTEEQRRYVDDMQTYLTQMGEKGNEVTRVLWGIDLFKEKIYFPLKSSKDFIYQANQPVQESSLKNDGMTKETKPGASNPIVLEAFDDVWATHVNRMSQYHAYVLPIENLNKVLNYGTWANTDAVAVSTMLRSRYGSAVNDYLNQFIGDLNGVRNSQGATAAFFSGMFTKFKKTAVAGSVSVVVQQPTAILRAQALVDGKYFVHGLNTEKLSDRWAEVKKYAPIAIIKDMGGFDAGAGRQTAEWLNADTQRGLKKISGKIDDVTMWGAAMGDQLGWCTIWEAVKRETLAKNPKLVPTSEEFMKLVGERFTEVIVKTQVYDSTLSRSGYMRSKNELTKMMTSFMGEPTVSANMLYDSVIQAKRGGISKRTAARRIGAVYLAVVGATLAKSLIYALRDDDDDEAYAEKYLQALGGAIVGDINPLAWLPGVRDVLSIFDGWEVERTDMALFQDLKNAIDGLDSENKSVWRKIEDFAGAVASFFGLPLKNVMRTAREVYNGFENLLDDISGGKLGKAFLEGVTGKETGRSEALYDAIMAGDAARLEVYRGDYKTEDAYNSALSKALRENDERIAAAAEARYNGDIAEYMRIAKEIISEGNFSQDNVVAAINAKMAALKKAEETGTEEQTEEDKVESIYKVDDFFKAVRGGDIATAYAVREDIVNVAIENGEDREDAEKAFESKLVTYVSEQYRDTLIGDSDAKSMLTRYGGMTEEKAASRVRYWAFKLENPEYEDLYEGAVNKYYDGYYKDGELYGKSAKSYGITLDVYAEYVRETSGLSKKEDIMYIINTLPLSKEQKDALYYLNGWAKSTIREAPWR